MHRKFAITITRKRGFYVIAPHTVHHEDATIIICNVQFTQDDLDLLYMKIPGGYMVTDNQCIMSKYLEMILEHFVKIVTSKRRITTITDVSFIVRGITYHTQMDLIPVDLPSIVIATEPAPASCCSIL